MAGTTMAPAMAAATDSPHIGQPPSSTMATVSSVPAATPKAPTPRRPRVSASRPPITRPMPAGVFVRMLKTVICQAREALLVAQELVEQLRGRRREQREQESRRREQPEARAVPGHAHLGVGGVVAAALGEVPGGEPHEREQQGGGGHHEAPPALTEVGEREGHEAEAGAEGAGGGEQREGERARPRRHLLRRDDADQHAARGGRSPHERLGDAEGHEVRRQRGQDGEDAADRRAAEQRRAAARAGRPGS